MAEVTIAVMGATGSGKTTFVNVASGSSLDVGAGLQSKTSDVHVTEPFELDGRPVKLIDTPGFDDTSRNDVDILHTIAQYLTTAYKEGKTLSGVIFIHRISDNRMSGISRRNFRMFRQLCGESTLKNVVIVTNMWGVVSEQTGAVREAELASEDLFFKPTLDAGARMMRHHNTRDSAHGVLRYIVNNHPLPLQIQEEVVDQHKDVSQTSAAEELEEELAKEAAKHRAEMERLQKEVEDAIRAKEEENRRKLEEETKRQQEELQKIEAESRRRAEAAERERRDAERWMREAAEKARQEAERAAAEFHRAAQEVRRATERAEAEARRQAEEIRRQIEHARRNSGGCMIQ